MTTAGVWFAMVNVYGLYEKPDGNWIGDEGAREGHQRQGAGEMRVVRWQDGLRCCLRRLRMCRGAPQLLMVGSGAVASLLTTSTAGSLFRADVIVWKLHNRAIDEMFSTTVQ